MVKFIIPAGTVVEVLLANDTWKTHTTKRQLEFDHYLSWGLNRMTFCESGRTLRVEHRLVKRTEEES